MKKIIVYALLLIIASIAAATQSQDARNRLICAEISADGLLTSDGTTAKKIPLNATLDRILIRNTGASKVTRVVIGTSQGAVDVMDTTSIDTGVAYNFKVDATIDGLIFHESASTSLYIDSDGWNSSSLIVTFYLKP